jgi:RNA-directed DNA polymerase
LNSGASWPEPKLAQARVLGIQRKLHKWSTDDQNRRFDDLHNLVCDPATLMVAWLRVRANRGSRSAGVDGQTARYIEQVLGVENFRTGLREELRSGSFRPTPVKERRIPKRGGKFRRLGVPTVRDRVVQAALKLVLEPILEADFKPCSYGYRPGRRVQDAIAEIHFLATPPRNYEWVVEADIKACFDELSHVAILQRLRVRIADKRVLALIKAFLKAGIMSEQGRLHRTVTGTPQGGILSPLLANVALSALDEHFVRAWESTGGQHGRHARRRRGEANYRLVRYADDFVILVAGERRHAEALIAETEQVIAPLGLALSKEKTSIAHIDEGIEFLGWRVCRQLGRNGRPQVYTYPSKPSLQAVKTKVKTITRTGQNQTLDQLLHRLNPVLRGWCAHYRHGVSSRTFNYLRAYVWRRVIIWLRHKHPKANWRWMRRRYLPGWWPTDKAVTLYNPAGVKITRYRYRGSKIPTPWEQPTVAYEQLSLNLERLETLIAG